MTDFGPKLIFYKNKNTVVIKKSKQRQFLEPFPPGYYFDNKSIKLLGWEERHLISLFEEVKVSEVFDNYEKYVNSAFIAKKHVEFIKGKVGGNSILQLDDYMGNAKKFWGLQPFFYDDACLFWLWNKNELCWNIVDETDLMNLIESELALNGATVKSTIKNTYLEAFKRVGRLNKPKPMGKTWIQFKNIVYDVKTSEQIIPSPDYFLTNPIPWDCVFEKETPYIDSCMASWVGVENTPLLKEIMAFCMIPEYFLHRIFCFIGGGSNGKSTYLEMARKLIGSSNCTSSDLDDIMGSRFEIAKLYKKLVCMMGETNFNTMGKTSKLKKLCGGDTVGFEFKNKNPFDDINYAKLLISTNGLPQTTDKTEGFYRRWILIDFKNKFSEKKDILAEIPSEEYSFLCGQCVKLATKLWREREFTNEGTVQERMEKYEAHSNPLKKFIETKCSLDCDSHTFKFDLRDHFQNYCKKHGYRTWNDKEIGIWMKEEGFETGQRNTEWHSSDGQLKRYRAYLGISLIEKAKKD